MAIASPSQPSEGVSGDSYYPLHLFGVDTLPE